MLLLAAAQKTGLLEALIEAVMALADPTIPELNPPNPVVIARLLLTLLFLTVAGLARTWDLRSYTGTMLAVVTGRERAYSQRYTERFLACLAHAGAAECLTEVVAQWTWSLWQPKQPSAEQPSTPAVFYVDGHRKAVYSDVLVPRGPVGKLGGKILGCRELVVLHDADGHPLLAMTHRGDHHVTIGLPHMLHCYEQATGQTLMQRVGEWQPWRSNRQGQVICEVATARFALKRPDDALPPLQVEVALIRDWRNMREVEQADETAAVQDWQADLAPQQQRFWEEGWQALPAPPAPTTPKLIPVITTGQGMGAVELAQTYFRRVARARKMLFATG